MMKNIVTISDAAHEWVRELNAIDTEIIRKLMDYEPYDWEEVTLSSERYDDIVPMWGTMWSFDDFCDDIWLEEMGGIEKMSECGFRIFHSENFGYFFGIDGAGYDFYESHWMPLYKARGLKWHDTESS